MAKKHNRGRTGPKAAPKKAAASGSRPKKTSCAAIIKAEMPGFQIVKRSRTVADALPIPDAIRAGQSDAVGSDVRALQAKFRSTAPRGGAGAIDVAAARPAPAVSDKDDLEVCEVTSAQSNTDGQNGRSKFVIVSKRLGKIVGFQG